MVIKDGREQRFCQQCGKFQPREDFDGEKRSCRARLEKHNARRRRQREMQHLLKKGVKMDPSVGVPPPGVCSAHWGCGGVGEGRAA